MNFDVFPRYAVRLAFVLTIAMVVTDCGGSAVTSPTIPAAGAALRAGSYMFTVSSSISVPETDAPCSQRADNSSSRSVSTRITIASNGDGWLGRSSSQADGDVELRLRNGSAGDTGLFAFPGGAPVAGTLRGVGMDDSRMPLFLPRDARVFAHGLTAGVDAQVKGALANSVGGMGSLDGLFTFTDSAGASTTCRGGAWTLFPALSLF